MGLIHDYYVAKYIATITIVQHLGGIEKIVAPILDPFRASFGDDSFNVEQTSKISFVIKGNAYKRRQEPETLIFY